MNKWEVFSWHGWRIVYEFNLRKRIFGTFNRTNFKNNRTFLRLQIIIAEFQSLAFIGIRIVWYAIAKLNDGLFCKWLLSFNSLIQIKQFFANKYPKYFVAFFQDSTDRSVWINSNRFMFVPFCFILKYFCFLNVSLFWTNKYVSSVAIERIKLKGIVENDSKGNCSFVLHLWQKCSSHKSVHRIPYMYVVDVALNSLHCQPRWTHENQKKKFENKNHNQIREQQPRMQRNCSQIPIKDWH